MVGPQVENQRYGQLLEFWFNRDKNHAHATTKGMSGLTRRAANSGTREMPSLHTSTFGWIELIGAVSNLRNVYGATNCDVH
eukprot:3202127-Lingulodinium_polyedra.AAC.1